MDQSRGFFIAFALAALLLAVLFALPRSGGLQSSVSGPQPTAAARPEAAGRGGPSAWDRLAQNEFAASIRELEIAFPALESVHLIGVALFFGSILMLDLRLLGAGSLVPAGALLRLVLPLTWAGFFTVLASGIPLFIAYADQYSRTVSFPLKMALVALGGLNMLAFHRSGRRDRRPVAEPAQLRSAAWGAGFSVLIWVATMVAGRWVGYERQPVSSGEPRPAPVVSSAASAASATVLFSREYEANAFAISVGEGSPPGEFSRLALETCGARVVCTVDIWEVLSQQATRRFAYARDRAAGSEQALWDCRRYPATPSAQCLPN